MKNKLLILLLTLFTIQLIGQSNNNAILVAERSLNANSKEPIHLIYGFQEGDKIILSVKTRKNKSLKLVQVVQNKVALYSKTKSSSFTDIEIDVPETGYVHFNFKGPSLGRRFELKIYRKITNPDGKYFNTALELTKNYDTTMYEYEIDSVIGYTEPEYFPKNFRVIESTAFESVEMYKKKYTIAGVKKKQILLTRPQDTIKTADKEMVLKAYQVIITSAAGAQAMWKAISTGVDIGSMFLGPVSGIAAGTAMDMIGPQEGGEPVYFSIMNSKKELAVFMDNNMKTFERSFQSGLATGYSGTWHAMDTLAIGLENKNIYAELKVSVSVFAVYQTTKWKDIVSNEVMIKPKTVRVKRTMQVIRNKKVWGFQH